MLSEWRIRDRMEAKREETIEGWLIHMENAMAEIGLKAWADDINFEEVFERAYDRKIELELEDLAAEVYEDERGIF